MKVTNVWKIFPLDKAGEHWFLRGTPADANVLII